jgi:hypothetical protein
MNQVIDHLLLIERKNNVFDKKPIEQVNNSSVAQPSNNPFESLPKGTSPFLSKVSRDADSSMITPGPGSYRKDGNSPEIIPMKNSKSHYAVVGKA